MKYLVLSTLILAIVTVEAAVPTSAVAARVCPNGGYCPAGTCAKFSGIRFYGHGASYACNVKNCSAANC